jgi:hypothetical protein
MKTKFHNYPNMTQNSKTTTTTQPVSTVTKHITIYSDNPIHDCIDRIIDAVIIIDEDDDWSLSASQELCDAADKLLALSWALRKHKTDEFRRSISARKQN